MMRANPPRAVRRFRMGLAPLLALLLHCAGNERMIDVVVEGSDADGVRSLEIEVSLQVPGGDPLSIPTERLLRRLDRFVLMLPAESRGDLQVRVAGLDAGGCQIRA